MYNSLVTYINYIGGGLPNSQGVPNTQGGNQKGLLEKNIGGFFKIKLPDFQRGFKLLVTNIN